jgi:ABC-type Fe3+-siderophore transport system permease subunit
MSDDEEQGRWQHRMMKLMMLCTAGMMLLCAGLVYHIFAK